MASELKKQNDLLKELSLAANETTKAMSDDSNLYFSMASIDSVSEDRTYCNVLLIPSNKSLNNVESIINIQALNSGGHLAVGDMVLVGYKYNYINPVIISKINKKNSPYTANKNMQLTNRINFGVLGV